MDNETVTASPPRLARRKDPLCKIGEVMRRTGISRQTLHNYTVRGLITEARRTPGNHRLYDESAFLRLALIQKLKSSKTLAEIEQVLANAAPAGPGRRGPRTQSALSLSPTG